MEYFIRGDNHSPVTGPYTVAQLRTKIIEGHITSQFLASSDLGESTDQLTKGRLCDWFSVRQIPGLPFQPITHKDASKPSAPAARRRIGEVVSILASASVGTLIESPVLRTLFWALILLGLLDTLGVFHPIKSLAKRSKRPVLQQSSRK